MSSVNELGYTYAQSAELNTPYTFTSTATDEVPLSVKGISGQDVDLQRWLDSSGAYVAQMHKNGQLYCDGGVHVGTPTGQSSILSWCCGGPTILHNLSSNSASFDYTGGAYENLFTDPAGVFDATDVGNWIVIRTGDYEDSFAEIILYISATQVLLNTLGWTYDLSDVGYIIIERPHFVIGHGHKHITNLNTDGHSVVQSNGSWVGDGMSNILCKTQVDCGYDDKICNASLVSANGYNAISNYTLLNIGDLGPGKVAVGSYTVLDVSSAVSANATTIVDAYVASVVNGTSPTTKAFVALAGFTTAFEVAGASEDDPDYGYEVTSTVVADRVNGGTADTTAFLSSSASNLTILDNKNDYILFGSDSTFEMIDVNLTSGGNRNAKLEYEYSKTGGGWTTLTGVIDTTTGFKYSGFIQFVAPGDWTKDDEAEVNGDITNAYYIKVKRTRLGLAVPPVEKFFKTRAARDTGMRVRGDGTIEPVILADASASNSSIYYSTDQTKLVFKDAAGVVNDLY